MLHARMNLSLFNENKGKERRHGVLCERRKEDIHRLCAPVPGAGMRQRCNHQPVHPPVHSQRSPPQAHEEQHPSSDRNPDQYIYPRTLLTFETAEERFDWEMAA